MVARWLSWALSKAPCAPPLQYVLRASGALSLNSAGDRAGPPCAPLPLGLSPSPASPDD